MDAAHAIKELQELVQLDIDAVRAYEQAIKNVSDQDICARLTGFMEEHENHIEDLGREIRRLGGEPPDYARDMKGLLLEGMTAVMSLAGTRAALMAMVNNELLTNNRYRAALEQAWTAPLRVLLEKNFHDEEGHLGYIRECLVKLAQERQGNDKEGRESISDLGFGDDSLGLQH